MSDLSTAARPYAKAVHELAAQSNELSEWDERLQFLALVCANEQVRDRLDDPTLGHEQLAQLLIDIAGDRLGKSGENLVRLMGENGRLALIPEVSRLFAERVAESQGIVEAEMISATEVSERQQQAVIESLRKRFDSDVRLDVSIDPDLIGGAIIKAGDMVIDGSVRGRMAQMSSRLAR